MFVNESAAAGCDIPNDSLAKIFSTPRQTLTSACWLSFFSSRSHHCSLDRWHSRKRYISNKFASKFIPIRAFHKAISRSCVLLRSNTSRLRQRWKIIPLLAHVSRPTGLIQGKASATTRKEMERAKKKRCGFTMFVIESAAAGCGIPNDSLRKKSPSRTATCTMLSRIYLYFS